MQTFHGKGSTYFGNCDSTSHQGCPQDVKSQERDETETLNPQDRDETRRSTFKTETRPRRFKRRLETAVSQFKNTNWWSLSLDNLFLVGQIHYFLPDISASLMDCRMITRLKSRDRDRDVISSRPRRDWDVRFFQTLETETRPRRSKKRLGLETFKTETTSLLHIALCPALASKILYIQNKPHID